MQKELWQSINMPNYPKIMKIIKINLQTERNMLHRADTKTLQDADKPKPEFSFEDEPCL